MALTPEMKRLSDKRERLMLRRAQLPENARTAIDAELKSVCDQLARLVAVAQGATEQPEGPGFAEWVETPTSGPLADPPGAKPEVVDLRGGKTVNDHLRERDGRVPRRPPHAA